MLCLNRMGTSSFNTKTVSQYLLSLTGETDVTAQKSFTTSKSFPVSKHLSTITSVESKPPLNPLHP